MCKVKSGVCIKTRQDVQNLVIGLIFRQQHEYSQGDILYIVEHYTQGAEVKLERDALNTIISKNLDILHRNGRIQCKNGIYRSQNILNVPIGNQTRLKKKAV